MSNFGIAHYHIDLNATLPESPATIDWRKGLLLFLAVLALSVPQAALLPLLDRDEPRFAEASREMLQSGNFIVPTFNHAPRYAKPPLIYWCQAISYLVFGENAFAARLPSLLATAATACLLMTWGTRLGSEQMGLGAALSYAFCFQTIQQGRVATADALLIFFMTLTAFTGWLIFRPKTPGCPRRVCFVVLAIGVAGGFLAKGPEALIPILPLFWCARGAGRNIILGLIASFFIGLALVLLWAIPAYIQTHGDYWRQGLSEGVGQRMVGGLQGHGASSTLGYLLGVLLYYPLFFLLGALPVWPLLLIHRKKIFDGWRLDLADTYLLLNAALIILVFSLMVTKLPHYTLPAFPFLALLFARRRWSVGFSPGLLTELGWVSAIIFFLLAFVGIPIALVSHATPSPVGELVRQAGNALTPETNCSAAGYLEPNVVWEFRRVSNKFVTVVSQDAIYETLDQPGPQAMILPTVAWKARVGSTGIHPAPEKKDIFPLQPNLFPPSSPPPLNAKEDNTFPSSWKIFEARGFNAAKGRFIDLTLVVKP